MEMDDFSGMERCESDFTIWDEVSPSESGAVILSLENFQILLDESCLLLDLALN